jgi:hypothetical protein
MRRLSLYARERIVPLLSTNTSVVGITNSLNEEGIKASRSAVNLFICRFRKMIIAITGFGRDKKRIIVL